MIATVNALMDECGTKCPYKISKKLGIRIKNLDLPESIRGLYVVSNAKKYILLNKRIDSHIDKCVVLAHELGHAVLHGNCVIQANGNWQQEGNKEYQASLFAAHLLAGGKELPCSIKREIKRCSRNPNRTHNLLVRLSFSCC